MCGSSEFCRSRTQLSCGVFAAPAPAGEEGLGMLLAKRLRSLRKQRNLSQGDIQKRTGLLRVYLSRVENGHTTPSIQTLEKLARALEIPLYRIFYTGKQAPLPPSPSKHTSGGRGAWGNSGKDARTLDKFRKLLKQMTEGDRKALLLEAQKMARRPGR